VVQDIYASHAAFAAIRKDGSAWGTGFVMISSWVETLVGIHATIHAFTKVVTWGSPVYGGNSSCVQDELSSGCW